MAIHANKQKAQYMNENNNNNNNNMVQLSDDLWMRILDHYLSDPADWAQWSATCRRFRRLGNPLCLQLILKCQQRRDHLLSSSSTRQQQRQYVLPQLLFLEPYDDPTTAVHGRRGGHHSLLVCVRNDDDDDSDNIATIATQINNNSSNKYRLWTYHKHSGLRAYLGRNHRYPNRTGNAYIHGLAFHVMANHHHDNEQEQDGWKDQYWTLESNDDKSCCFKRLKIAGNCTPSSNSNNNNKAMDDSIYNSTPRDLDFDGGNWFVHSCQSTRDAAQATVTSQVSCELRPFQLGRLSTGNSAQESSSSSSSNNNNNINNNNNNIKSPTFPIAVQPRPFCSQDGGWNLYQPGVWQDLLGVPTVQQGMVQPRNGGRCTSLQFHAWIQDSYFYCHAQYLVFPLRLPILKNDNIQISQTSMVKDIQEEEKESFSFLCDYLSAIFSLYHHGSGGGGGRWEALRHYLSMAANELSRYQYLQRRHAAVTGRNDYRLPPPSRTDDVPDAADDGSLGLTATHAANTWQPPACFGNGAYQYEYAYQACRVDDPTEPPQRLNWNNVLSLQCSRRDLTSRQKGEQQPERLRVLNDEELDLDAPNHPKDTSQPAWSIVCYA